MKSKVLLVVGIVLESLMEVTHGGVLLLGFLVDSPYIANKE